jgi:CheY-like chemotaxis protein
MVIGGRGSVLLVDDEKPTLDVCSEMLRSLGYRVQAVTSGEEALRAVRSQSEGFDVVIVDMIMPGMNGFETVAGIRSVRPGTKVILSSGYSRQDDIEAIREKGFDAFLQKPFDVAMLSEKISEVAGLRP